MTSHRLQWVASGSRRAVCGRRLWAPGRATDQSTEWWWKAAVTKLWGRWSGWRRGWKKWSMLWCDIIIELNCGNVNFNGRKYWHFWSYHGAITDYLGWLYFNFSITSNCCQIVKYLAIEIIFSTVFHDTSCVFKFPETHLALSYTTRAFKMVEQDIWVFYEPVNFARGVVHAFFISASNFETRQRTETC